MRLCVAEVCECLIRNEERLNELDRGSGDGDCGSTMTAGCTGERERPLYSITEGFLNRLYLARVCVCVWNSLARDIRFSFDVVAAIKQRLSAMEWDSPQKVLLSLASIVERHMGGTSGAVRPTHNHNHHHF